MFLRAAKRWPMVALRWCVAIAGSLAAFGGTWYLCQSFAGLDPGTSWAIAGAVLAVALAVLAWWAGREPGVADRAVRPACGAAVNIGRHADLSGDVITISRVQNEERSSGTPPRRGQPAMAHSAIAGDIPGSPPAFQPRSAVRSLLAERQDGQGMCAIYAVTGMRGVGKSQAAAACARQRIAEKWRLVAWVNADSSEAVLDGLSAAAATAGIPLGDDHPSTARILRHWLEADGQRCLVVFDDAADPDMLRPYLPAAGRASIVITSTRRSIAALGADVPVGLFTNSEALAYLSQRTGIDDTNGAAEIADELGYLPLALAQAAAVIKSQRISYTTYLEQLRHLPIDDYLPRTSEDPYPHATAAAILLSLQAVDAADSSGLTRPLMGVIALLSPAGVPRDMLRAAAASGIFTGTGQPPRQEHGQRAGDAGLAHVAPASADAVLARLADASLLSFSHDGSSVAAHRLVMRVIREQRTHDATISSAASAAIALLKEATREAEPPWTHRIAARDLAQQITALASYLPQGRDDASAQTRRMLLTLRVWAARCATALADNPVQAVDLCEATLTDCERALGGEHPDTLIARHCLASAYYRVGRDDDAIAMHERNLAIREHLLGDDHPDTMISRNNLANSYCKTQQFGTAIGLHTRNLAIREHLLGDDHPATMTSRNNLATCYQDAGEVDQAIALHERNLADRQRALGDDHADTFSSRGNLALCYQKAGRLAEAIVLLERTLGDFERAMGADHPDTMAARGELARAYEEAGRLPEAIDLHEVNLAGRQRILGADHPDTSASRDDLARARQKAAPHSQAYPLCQRVTAGCRQAAQTIRKLPAVTRHRLGRAK
jgi:tetratricopeptide (TPR) repeat protein